MKQPFLSHTLFVLAAVGMAAIPTKALAHQVQTNYILDGFGASQPDLVNENQATGNTGDSLEIQSSFSNGQPLKGAVVKVYSPEQPNRVWSKGLTDGQGRYTFEPDVAISGDWEINIKRGGHQDILTVPVTESGINADQLAQGTEIRDIHYASSPLMAVGGIAIAAASIGVARYSRKKSAE